MISTSVKELKLLQDAVEKGIIDITKVNREMQMIKEKEILAAHPHKIWQGTNGLYYTYIDEDGKRKLKKRTSREAIEKLIIEEYEAHEKNKAYILECVFFGKSYELLKPPCGRRQFYEKYREFFWMLDKVIS